MRTLGVGSEAGLTAVSSGLRVAVGLASDPLLLPEADVAVPDPDTVGRSLAEPDPEEDV